MRENYVKPFFVNGYCDSSQLTLRNIRQHSFTSNKLLSSHCSLGHRERFYTEVNGFDPRE